MLKSSKMSQTKTEIKAEKRNTRVDSLKGEDLFFRKFRLSRKRMKDHQAKQ